MKRLLFDASQLTVSREYYESRRPIGVGISIWVIIIFFVALIIWAYFFEIEEVVRGSVTIRPLDHVSAVVNPLAGEVEAVHFVDGEAVREGSLLYVIDTTEVVAKIEALEPQLQQVQERLLQLSALNESMQAGDERADPSLLDAESQHRLAEYHFTTQRYQFQIQQTRNRLDREQETPSQFTSAVIIEGLVAELNLAESEYNAWKATMYADLFGEIRSLTESEMRISGELSILEAERESATVSASISGVVQRLRELNPGDRLSQDERVLQIIPAGEENYRVQIELLTQDIAELEEGMPIRIEFSSLPPSEYGFVEGTVSSIPADATIGSNDTPVFLVEGIIPTSTISKKGGHRVSLHPGMGGEARVVRRKKSVVRFVLEIIDFWN